MGLDLQSPDNFTLKHFSTKHLIHCAICPAELNKGFNSRFCVGFWVRLETPEQSRKTYRPKLCKYNTEDNSPNILIETKTAKVVILEFNIQSNCFTVNVNYFCLQGVNQVKSLTSRNLVELNEYFWHEKHLHSAIQIIPIFGYSLFSFTNRRIILFEVFTLKYIQQNVFQSKKEEWDDIFLLKTWDSFHQTKLVDRAKTFKKTVLTVFNILAIQVNIIVLKPINSGYNSHSVKLFKFCTCQKLIISNYYRIPTVICI